MRSKAAISAALFEFAAIAVMASLCWAAPYNDPLYVRLLGAPSPEQAAILDGGGRKHSAYEVYVTNFGATPMRISEVGVAAEDGNGKVLFSQKNTGAKLGELFRSAKTSSNLAPEKIELGAGDSGVLFLYPQWADAQGTPARFATSITIEGSGERGGSGVIHLAPLAVSPAAPIVIESPLRGANWMAMNGPSNTSDHRRAIIPYDGLPYIGQRYAIDWVQVGADGRTWTGNYHSNASYHAFNQEIHAVAGGKIVDVTDGIPENVPNSDKLAIEVTDKNIAGNHVIEDLGGGHFAAYAHLRPGSLKVKIGDQVKAGDVLGRLGNSGNSSEPHLHFQVCDAPSFLKSEGLPFAIKQFVHQEYKIHGPRGHSKLILGATHQISDEEPMENELDSFPSS